jgi:hypothetical protein
MGRLSGRSQWEGRTCSANPHAGRILFGVVVGLGLILLAPSIVA